MAETGGPTRSPRVKCTLSKNDKWESDTCKRWVNGPPGHPDVQVRPRERFGQTFMKPTREIWHQSAPIVCFSPPPAGFKSARVFLLARGYRERAEAKSNPGEVKPRKPSKKNLNGCSAVTIAAFKLIASSSALLALLFFC